MSSFDSKSLNNYILQFKKFGLSFLKTLSENNLSSLIQYANQEYYENSISLLSDDQYDILREYILQNYPDNKIAINGHKMCNISGSELRKKVKLPCNMPSMDKLKDAKKLNNWFEKYKTNCKLISAKLDGVSGLYCYMFNEETDKYEHKLFTRGNGTYGQDISYLIKYLNLPNLYIVFDNIKNNIDQYIKNIIIRGEFIIPKKLFQEKYNDIAANPRNFVAGIINSNKNIDSHKIKDIDFVVYELINPIITPCIQIEYLNKLKFNTVLYKFTNFSSLNYDSNINKKLEFLSNTLIEWRNLYKYEIDGIICTDNDIYKRTSSNPEHSFAFKMVLSEQIAETLVLDVIWNPSKDGYLKPTVQIQPVFLSGAEINYVTGCNAKNIIDNGIGTGAKISIIRSGDVIPDIKEVLISTEPTLPNISNDEYSWNSTNVDFVLNDLSLNKDVQIKIITKFFKTIKVDGMGEGIIKKLYESSFDSISKILAMTFEDFINIEGFQDKLANKIYTNINNSIKTVSLSELIVATNIFGRGFGLLKINSILNNYPNVLIDNINKFDKIQKMSEIDGVAIKTATYFVEKIDEFIKWLTDSNLLHFINKNINTKVIEKDKNINNKKIFVMSGTRNKDLINKLTNNGFIESNSITQSTSLLIIDSLDRKSTKIEKAKKYNIPTFTHNDIISKFKF